MFFVCAIETDTLDNKCDLRSGLLSFACSFSIVHVSPHNSDDFRFLFQRTTRNKRNGNGLFVLHRKRVPIQLPSMWAVGYKTAGQTMVVFHYQLSTIAFESYLTASSEHIHFSISQWQPHTTPSPQRPTTTLLPRHIIPLRNKGAFVSVINAGPPRTLLLPDFACAVDVCVFSSLLIFFRSLY